MAKSHVTASWGRRAESVDEAADRIARLLAALGEIDPALTRWRNLDKSKRQSSAQPVVGTAHADLVQRLLGGRHRGDFDHEAIDDLGYSVHWWNGGAPDDRGAAKLMAHAAAGSLGNSVVLNLPELKAAPSLYARDTAHRVLHALVRIFEPDAVVWSSAALLSKQKEPDRRSADGAALTLGRLVGEPAGWANYLSDTNPVQFDPRLMPATATVERVGAGTLVMLGEDPADPPVADVLRLHRAMGPQAAQSAVDPAQ